MCCDKNGLKARLTKMLTLWILLLMSFSCTIAQDFFFNGKQPLTISVTRLWNVYDDTAVGGFVGKISTTPEEDDIVYGLEPLDVSPLPFVINAGSGVVYTNQSLTTWLGRRFRMYVSAQRNDTNELTSKTEVLVQITKRSDKNQAATNQNTPPPNMKDYFNFIKNSPELLQKKPHTKLNSVNDTSSASSTTTKSAVKSTTSNVHESSHVNAEQSTRTEEAELPMSSTPSTVANKSKNGETELVASKQPNDDKLIIAFIPTILLFMTAFILGGTVYLFRKKICRRRSKIKKDDMKKSSCSVLSLEEPIILHHWRNGRGLSNRCDSWDSDSHTQGTVGLNSDNTPLDRWEIPRHHIRVFNILGEGCFGQVWKCEALNIDGKEGPSIVAVKMLKENAGEQERSDLAQELQVMKMLDPHPNVVRLLGCCTEKEPIFVIMEYVTLGKLQSYLRKSRDQHYYKMNGLNDELKSADERCYNNMHGSSKTLTSQDLTSFCYQIAKGMQYLSSKGIIHRDLAARNILVGENDKKQIICKVADFGFARDVMTSHVYERKSEGRLPIRWMAPESLYYNVFSVKSDVWSFGVLLWEIVTLGSTPYPGIPAAKVMSKVRDGYRLEKPEHCMRELYLIMYYCWNKDPSERPAFDELVDNLEDLLSKKTDYILLDQFPEHSYYNIVSSLSDEKL